MLSEKVKSFVLIVITCRPSKSAARGDPEPEEGPPYPPVGGGLTHAQGPHVA